MIDFAEPLIIPRPKTRIMDKLISMINALIPYIIAVLIGGALGIGQGYLQCEHAWREKVVERSVVDPSGIALPVYEDVEGNVYYVHREVRP